MPHKPEYRLSAPASRPPQWGSWLSWSAFVLAAALVLARSMMLETLRNPLDVQPGAEPVPRGPGAGTGLVLDLLCCVPALLVLARRALDPACVLRFTWALVPMGLLAAWTVLSTSWAGDRFAAVVAGTHWLSACVLLWAAVQLVDDWARLRLVAAACVGMLLVQAGQGLYYRYVEHPELVSAFKSQRDQILRQRGWEPDSFVARQFEKRVLSGEMMGFTSSPNSFAAVLVLLTFVALGLNLQGINDRDDPRLRLLPAAALALGGLVIVFVNSRTALGTTLLGLAMLGVAAALRTWLARHSRLAFGAAVAAAVVAVAAVVGHGVYHGTLFHDSLTFRWRYWVAAAKLFADHPLLGVGWENFGAHYLAYRLPVAAEEIKDPHNFLVRFATELGVVGLVLVLAWLLALWWALTQKPLPEPTSRVGDGPDPPSAAPSSLVIVASIGVLGTLVNVVASIDWQQAAAYNALEVLRRVGLLCLFVVGGSVAALRSARRQDLDDRPAPWVVRGMLVGLGLFLVHNLVDFSLFEPGPMFLFAWLCGAALGVRLATTTAQRTAGRGAALGALAGAVIGWLVAAGGLAAPVALAERAADDGDEALRNGRFGQASTKFLEALGTVGYNADYAFRAARAMLADPWPGSSVYAISLLDRAIALDPNRPQYFLHRANARLRSPSPDQSTVRADYEQALRLDPNNVEARLEFADILARFGDRAAAVAQYREALRYNDLLSPDEPKRLPPKRLEEVQALLSQLAAPPA